MNNKSKTLSLVIPAYNEERYLRNCLDAIAAQTIMPDEVIVVDNNSTDKTAEIARSYPFVTLIREKRQGLRFTRNTGLNAATGDILGRIDADTRLTPNWCKTAKQTFASGEVTALTGPCYYHDMPFQKFGHVMDRMFRSTLFSAADTMLYGSNMLLARRVWQDIRSEICMEGEFFEDCDMSIHVYDKGYSVSYNPKLVVGVSARRLDDSPLSFYKNMKMYDQTYARHGLFSVTATGAKCIYLSSYFPLKLVRKAYDPEQGSMSLSRLLDMQEAEARPNSNT